MHAAVFEAGWKSEELMPRHREVIARDHRGKGREVIGIDWTLSHHDRGTEIFGVKRAYDYVDKRMSAYQTVVTAAIANREMIDGLEVVVQTPDYQKEELAYLKITSRDNYEKIDGVIPNPPLKPPFSLGNLSPRLPVSPSPRLSPGKGGSQPGFGLRSQKSEVNIELPLKG